MTCGLSHQLCDEDVLQIQKKMNKGGQTISNMSANAQKMAKGENMKEKKVKDASKFAEKKPKK